LKNTKRAVRHWRQNFRVVVVANESREHSDAIREPGRACATGMVLDMLFVISWRGPALFRDPVVHEVLIVEFTVPGPAFLRFQTRPLIGGEQIVSSRPMMSFPAKTETLSGRAHDTVVENISQHVHTSVPEVSRRRWLPCAPAQEEWWRPALFVIGAFCYAMATT